jgi:hypothetical protein
MSLFQECLQALGKYARVIDKNEANKILTKFDIDFRLTHWGRIDWDKIKKKHQVSSIEEINSAIKGRGKELLALTYVIGSNSAVPIIECRINKILEFFDDVEALSPNSWFYCPSEGWVVEVCHDGTITVGFSR